MKFLGFDSAIKTFAFINVDINLDIFDELDNILEWIYQLIKDTFGKDLLAKINIKSPTAIEELTEMLTFEITNEEFFEELLTIMLELDKILSNFVKVHNNGVVDLVPEKKAIETSKVEITKAVREVLDTRELNVDPMDTFVVIECQPNKLKLNKVNTQSVQVSHSIAMYYAKYQFDFIDPKLKNNIALRSDLTLAAFLEKYKDNKNPKYISRKAQSRANFEYFLDVFNKRDILKGIKKSVYDDQADAFMQILAYILDKKMFSSGNKILA
jgi:hypothetical protein